MLTLLSPSKSVTDKKIPLNISPTNALFPDTTDQLAKSLQKLSKKQLRSSLEISEQLADLNYKRYKAWESTEEKSAFWLYSGDVYNGLDAFSLNKLDVNFAQKHVAIISGLYGLVRPLDAIRPYRLEMRLPYSGRWGENLYEAWSEKLSNYMNRTGHTIILMCASKEYANAAAKNLSDTIRVITPRFMQETGDGLKEKALYAKYARGKLARYVINNRLDSLNGLQNYAEDGFSYSKDLSTDNELIYIIPKDFSLKGRFTAQ